MMANLFGRSMQFIRKLFRALRETIFVPDPISFELAQIIKEHPENKYLLVDAIIKNKYESEFTVELKNGRKITLRIC